MGLPGLEKASTDHENQEKSEARTSPQGLRRGQQALTWGREHLNYGVFCQYLEHDALSLHLPIGFGAPSRIRKKPGFSLFTSVSSAMHAKAPQHQNCCRRRVKPPKSRYPPLLNRNIRVIGFRIQGLGFVRFWVVSGVRLGPGCFRSRLLAQDIPGSRRVNTSSGSILQYGLVVCSCLDCKGNMRNYHTHY